MLISDMLKLISPLKVVDKGLLNEEVKRISYDSRDTEKSSVFFAYKGEAYDSTKDAESIYKSGLADFIVSEIDLGNDIPHALIHDGRKALSTTLAHYFGNPLGKMKTVAVTGTNGKTTTTYILDAIFQTVHPKTMCLGTTGAMILDKRYPLENTTPSAYDFYCFLAIGVKNRCRFATMEVSSHALAQGRIAGACFDVAVFTNLTGDHLDFHQNMDNYFNAKAMLFNDDMSKLKVINTRSRYGKQLASLVNKGLITYSLTGEADVYPISHSFGINGIKAKVSVLGKEIEIESHLTGEYNLENILGAIGAAKALNVDDEAIINGLKFLKSVPGRLDRVPSEQIHVFVDYAHTDDALMNVLSTLSQLKKKRIITVFGAGGDRDNTKRPRMGRVAGHMSDIVIVTSDNPRTEDPVSIIEQIIAGIEDKSKVVTEPDREKAIAYAVTIAEKDDIVLIAGKGHEDYQIIGNTKHPFDDRSMAAKYLVRTKKC